MSPESDIKPIQRTNSGHVIVFDPATQTLTTEKAKRLKDYDAKLQTAPKLGSRVDIFVDSRLVATINLSKLSWATNTKRFFGKCNQILVMELPDGILPPRIKA
ncbi:hypothetical protein OEA41_006328 [Lepraria neglecta]|uniref:Uncharacterized protein n=1 Tax=Lepraria neglecta TaxID=209136 RepID=A0AAD9Z7H7_9LECA|nr:hypothetical protein OEA41_006328 [Lepraria neglecta]